MIFRNMYSMIFLVTLVSGLLMFMIGDLNSVYNQNNLNLSYLDKSQELQNQSSELNDAIQNLQGKGGGISISGTIDFITNGFLLSLSILFKSFMFFPSLIGDIISNLLPEDIANIVTGNVIAYIIILLVFGALYLLGGKRL